MKRNTVIGLIINDIIIIAIVLILVFSVLKLNQPVQQPIQNQVPLLYNGTLTTVKGYEGAVLEMFFHSNGTLFNCTANVTYTATNGSWVQIVKQIGIVDTNAGHFNTDFELTDYQTGNISSQVQFTQADNLEKIKIDAYGYTTP
jgi:hypothetical protein